MGGYAHLHAASGFSVRYGAARPEQLVAAAAERGIGAVALTDRDTVAGAVRFVQAADAAGIRPVLGVDLAVDPIERPEPGAVLRRGTVAPDRGGAHVVEPRHRVVLLAQDRTGWARLCRIVSAAHARGAERGPAVGAGSAGWPIASWEDLREHGGDGVLVLLGPVSEPGRALSASRADIAARLVEPWRQVFGDGVRMETVSWGLAGTGPGSVRLAARTLALADRLRIPAVLTNAVRYAHPGQHRLADVLDAARLLRPIDRRRLDPRQRWLKDARAMAAVAQEITDCAGGGPRRAARLLADTAAAAEACTLDATGLGLGVPHFPEPVVVGADDSDGAADRLLRERAEAGMVRRGLAGDAAAVARLEQELQVITELGYSPYFLAVGQVVADIRERGIRVAARGSGAGSMVCHALAIATANPLDHSLLFERFMSRRRRSLPDIDIDVESARRLECYDLIFERFGRDRVAVTGMPETYRARRALRDTGLALGIAPAEVDRIAKAFPHLPAGEIRRALAELPELEKLRTQAGDGRYGPLFELAEGLDSLLHGFAMHPCGVILSDASLLDRLPVQPTVAGYPMVQAAKNEVEDMGLIKLDVLGVRMQSAMAHAVGEIERTTGRAVDLDDGDQVPLDDFFAFKLLQSADTIGLFQLESPGQRDLLSRLQPRDPQDVIADISLFRPGPVAGGMPERYIAARHGEAPRYPHRDLEPVLADTYGVVIWHEQIIGILAQLTGCDLAAAEVARRALGDPDRLPRLEAWFHSAAAARGYSPQVRQEVWGTVREFGAYGFCRAHAVAFAVPALQSAWLKAHHPAALYAGLLEHDPGMWPARVLAADARRHGVTILPVDVQRSRASYAVEPVPGAQPGVRLALTRVRGISTAEAKRIEASQPYESLADFWARARPALPIAERLAEIGALDGLHAGSLTRRDLLLQLGELHRQATAARRGADGQLPLAAAPIGGERPSGLPDMTGRERVSAELDVLRIDVSHHLMEHHHRLLREIGAVDAAHLHQARPGQRVLVAGVRAATSTPPIASGKRIIFTTLEDGSGLVDLVFFEDSHAACAHTVFHSGLLLVRGQIQVRGGRPAIVGQAAWDLDHVAAVRRDRGPEAALALLTDTTIETGTRPGTEPMPTGPREPARTGRVLVDTTTGARAHAYADLEPAGSRSADLARLAHRSPGSAG
ncbi:DNA polymerase III subunit alpha [Streptomyces misionensis]|uniref:DNA polymerase III subunit alpha n=1 Tax=Streptomyces misionensis TaxID=67331 RepID=UPI00341CEBDB